MPERPAALMVSLAGFQSGARTFAANKGIGLYVLHRDRRGRSVARENPATESEGCLGWVTLAGSLADVLVDAMKELHRASETKEIPWSIPVSRVAFPRILLIRRSGIG